MRGEWQVPIKEEGRGEPGSQEDSHRRGEMGSELGSKGLDWMSIGIDVQTYFDNLGVCQCA